MLKWNDLHELERKAIIVGIALILLLIFISKGCREDALLLGNRRYTIGTVTGYKSVKFRYNYNYEFMVNGKAYTDRSTFSDRHEEWISKRFFVAYYPNDPDISEVFFYNPVPDSISHAPKNGWEETNVKLIDKNINFYERGKTPKAPLPRL